MLKKMRAVTYTSQTQNFVWQGYLPIIRPICQCHIVKQIDLYMHADRDRLVLAKITADATILLSVH